LRKKQLQNSIKTGLLEQIMFELTPKGRQRIIRNDVIRQAVPELAAAIGKARLPTVDSSTSGTTRLLGPAERRARRPRRSATRMSEPRQDGAPQCRTLLYVRTASLFSLALSDPQPVKADECISDVVTGPQSVDKTSCCVEYRLELADQVSRQADQYTITVVQYRAWSPASGA